jgi:hypothetical protein
MTQQSTISKIARLRDNTFEENYNKHDVGTAMVRDRLSEHGLLVFEHGDDRRDEDVYSGTGVDQGVQYDGQTCGYVEVKTKTSAEWLGRCNHHDWQEYVGFAQYVDVPVYVYFALVEDVESAHVSEEFFVEVLPSSDESNFESLPFSSKGHRLVEASEDSYVRWPTVLSAFFDQLA